MQSPSHVAGNCHAQGKPLLLVPAQVVVPLGILGGVTMPQA